jgi:hypothetical protein
VKIQKKSVSGNKNDLITGFAFGTNSEIVRLDQIEAKEAQKCPLFLLARAEKAELQMKARITVKAFPPQFALLPFSRHTLHSYLHSYEKSRDYVVAEKSCLIYCLLFVRV